MQIDLFPDQSLLAIVAIFILNYWVVRKFFLQPVNAVLEERAQETKSAEAVYEQALGRFNDATAKMEEQLHLAKRDASQMRDRFRGEAAAHRQQMVDRTTAEAKEIVAEADKKLSADVAVAREQIVKQSDSLAHQAATQILGRAV